MMSDTYMYISVSNFVAIDISYYILFLFEASLFLF